MKRIGIFAGIFLITFLFLAPTAAFAAEGTNAPTTAQKEACAKVLGVKIDDANFVTLCLNSTAAAYAVGQATIQTTAGTQAAASGGGGGSILGTILGWGSGLIQSTVLEIINFLIGGVVKILVSLAIILVKWAIDINYTITNANSESLAYFGWGLTLNFANLLFVLAIVAIAFGIMFRRAWAKKSLPKLIIVALLINFSFFIAKELITIADSITKIFLNTGTLNLKSFADFFTGDSVWKINWNDPKVSAGSVIAAQSAQLFGPIFAIVFGFIAFLTLLAVAVAFLVRYVSLTILLILLPLALGMSLFSIKVGKMPNAWQEWQDKFLKWLIFGPAAAFFIYLSFGILKYPPATPTGGPIQVFGSEIGNYIAIIGILLGGLMVANKLGVAGSGIAQSGINQAFGQGSKLIKRGQRANEASMRQRTLAGMAPTRLQKALKPLYKGLASSTQATQKQVVTSFGGKFEAPKIDKDELRTARIKFIKHRAGKDPKIILDLFDSEIDEIAKNGSHQDQLDINDLLNKVRAAALLTPLAPKEQGKFDKLNDNITDRQSKNTWAV